MYYLLLALAWTGVASFFDLKSREIPPVVTYSLFLTGTLAHGVESYLFWDYWPILSSLSTAVLCFFFAYLLYRVGFWAGGDVKLFTALGALVPNYGSFVFFPFWVLAGAFFVVFPFAIAYVTYFFAKRRKLRRLFVTETKKSCINSIFSAASILTAYNLTLIAGFWPLVFLAPLFYFIMAKSRLTFLVFFVFIAKDTVASLAYFAGSFAASFIFLLGFACLKIAMKEILRERIKAKDLSEGMILAHNLVMEKGKPVFAGSVPAGKALIASMACGLTDSDIAKIKKLGVKEVEIKKSLPFVPLLFCSMVLLASLEHFFPALI